MRQSVDRADRDQPSKRGAGDAIIVTCAWMFGPERETSCPSCAAFLDGIDGAARHVMFRTNLAAIARGPIDH